jgi:hypothetical protein
MKFEGVENLDTFGAFVNKIVSSMMGLMHDAWLIRI